MNKEELVKEISSFPLKYAVLMGFFGEDKQWDVQKLTFLEMSRLKDMHRDLKTFERNNKVLNGE